MGRYKVVTPKAARKAKAKSLPVPSRPKINTEGRKRRITKAVTRQTRKR